MLDSIKPTYCEDLQSSAWVLHLVFLSRRALPEYSLQQPIARPARIKELNNLNVNFPPLELFHLALVFFIPDSRFRAYVLVQIIG